MSEILSDEEYGEKFGQVCDAICRIFWAEHYGIEPYIGFPDGSHTSDPARTAAHAVFEALEVESPEYTLERTSHWVVLHQLKPIPEFEGKPMFNVFGQMSQEEAETLARLLQYDPRTLLATPMPLDPPMSYAGPSES